MVPRGVASSYFNASVSVFHMQATNKERHNSARALKKNDFVMLKCFMLV